MSEPNNSTTQDIFSKAYAFKTAQEITEMGLHPYFKPLQATTEQLLRLKVTK